MLASDQHAAGNREKPLSGIKVIDAARVLAGPFCGQMLADQGADVIKIESAAGDENRHWSPFSKSGESCNFMSVNRGKRAITLNLKSDDGKGVFHKLLAEADVLIHSFLPSTALKLGIDAEKLARDYPRLVICEISAFGGKGDMRDLPGYDTLFQAFSGIMSMTGYPDGDPARAGVSFIDMTTGILGYCAIVTALMGRAKTGNGDIAGVSLLETATTLLGYHAVSWLELGTMPHREGSGIWHLVPYQAFSCTDGQFITGALNDNAWGRLCNAIDRPDMAADPELSSNEKRLNHRARIVQIFADCFATDTVAAWTKRLEAHDVAVAPLHTIDQALTHKQTLANEMVIEMVREGTSIRLLGLPFKLRSSQTPSTLPPPRLGQHTDEVLRSVAGLNEDEIARLRASGAV